jgi:hypothetical protein
MKERTLKQSIIDGVYNTINKANNKHDNKFLGQLSAMFNMLTYEEIQEILNKTFIEGK